MFLAYPSSVYRAKNLQSVDSSPDDNRQSRSSLCQREGPVPDAIPATSRDPTSVGATGLSPIHQKTIIINDSPEEYVTVADIGSPAVRSPNTSKYGTTKTVSGSPLRHSTV